MERGRLEAFSDGVFAVAITLLALNLVVPGPGHGPLGSQLVHHWPAFAAYVVSFLTIGIIWVNHHALFANFSEIDRPLLFINLLLLFFVVTIPFVTHTIADYLTQTGSDASLAAALFQAVFEGLSICFVLLFWWAIRRDHLKVQLTRPQARRALFRFGAGNLAYLVAIGIAFVSAPVSLLIAGLVAFYYIFEHTPAQVPASQATGNADGAQPTSDGAQSAGDGA